MAGGVPGARARDVLIAQVVLLFEGPRGGVPIHTPFLAFANLTLGSANLTIKP